MASNINPNNIDGTYPIAGQDNDSQGFRDNFTNIKTNFTFASAEITDLQSKVVLKAPLTGTTLDNNMGGSVLSNAQLQDMSEIRVALGTPSPGTVTLNYAAGPYYTLTTTGAMSLAFTNFPPAGQAGRMRVQINVASIAHSIILPSAVSVGTVNLQGYASNTITFNRTGIYEYEFETSDGGTTISVFDLNRNRDPVYLPSSEDLGSTSAANLNVTTSYFSTTGTETATLAAGFEGQIKIFAMRATLGTMTITVANAAWGGAGTMTFANAGDSCIMQYIASKWFVIGNNGVTLA